VSFLLCSGLAAPFIDMVIGADIRRAGDDRVHRSTNGFTIGCSIVGGCIVTAVEVLVSSGLASCLTEARP
jgi:hypothetical protein